MREKLKQFKPALLKALGYGTLSCLVLIGDQIRRFFDKISEATSTNVLAINRIQPTYIYIEDPYVQEEIAADVTGGKERLKLPIFHKWVYDKIEESFIFRNFFSFKKNLAWRYLQLAQDENKSYRFRAIRSLTSLMNLSDADYQQLAQACDMKTAIGLARTSENGKFLLDPPHFKMKPNKKAIVKSIHNLFLNLDSNSKHPCLQYFVSKVILGMTDFENKGFDDDFRIKFDKRDFLPLCLEALLHHSWKDENAKEIVNYGALPLLMEVYKYLISSEPENVDSLIVLVTLLANISICKDCTYGFFQSGWIKILSILGQHKDIRISAPAQKALANFDEDYLGSSKYLRSVYPLYPTRRTLSQPKLDVIFVHGLLGEIFVTWRQRDSTTCSHKSPLELLASKMVPSFPILEPGITSDYDTDRIFAENKPIDQDYFVDVAELHSWEKLSDSYEFVLSDIPVDCNSLCSGPFYVSRKDINNEPVFSFTKCWPKDWLPHDCPEINLLGINYETNISEWTPLCPISPSRTILERSKLIVTALCKAGVGKRPIVWVGHSMGGLIIKGVLSLAHASSDPVARALFEQTRGIVFYSTPHKGSRLAALNPTSQMIVWPSVEVQELRENSPVLLHLHDEFLKMVKEIPVKVISFNERKSSFITGLKIELRFVDSHSADIEVGEVYGIPLDHLSICKPSGRQSFLYQKLKKLILELINEKS